MAFKENIDIMQKCVNFAQKILQKELKYVQNQGSEMYASQIAYLARALRFNSTNVIPKKYAVEVLQFWLLQNFSSLTIPCCFKMWKFW